MPCNKFSMLFISTSRSASRELLLFLSRRKGKDYRTHRALAAYRLYYILHKRKEERENK